MVTCMSSTKKLLADIEAFLAKTGMSETEFNRTAAPDHHFIRRLRSGKSCTLATADSVRLFMATYKARARMKRRTGPLGSSAAA